MARPTAFDRQTSFTQFSSQFPAKPQNGASLDAEFNAVKLALDETQSNLGSIQDDDGQLARGSVGRGQLDSSITLGFATPRPWVADTAYDADVSTVFYQAKFYSCIETHTSGDTFDASKWFEIADLSASAAIDPLSITDDKLAPSAVTSDKIAPVAVTTDKLATGAVTTAKMADASVTIAKFATGIMPALAALLIPAGLGPLPWSGRTAPAGWVLAGGTYNRADYPVLWTFAAAEIASGANTLYGAGDGATTFTIADPKGRTLVGVDAAAAVVGGLTALGATAGAKEITLTTAQIPAHKHINTLTDPGHNHTIPSPFNKSTQIQQGTSTVSGWAGNGSGDTTGFSGTGVTITNADAGGGGAHSNVQPSMAVNFIVKAH